PELRPLKIGPCRLEPGQRPAAQEMLPPGPVEPPHALGDVAARVEHAPAQCGKGVADAVIEDERSQAAAEEAELGHAFRPQSRYLRLEVLPQRGDEITEDRRVGGHEYRRGRLVGDDMVTHAAEPSYRPSQRGDGGAVRADEDDRGGSPRGGPELLAPEATRRDGIAVPGALAHPQVPAHISAGRSARCT